MPTQDMGEMILIVQSAPFWKYPHPHKAPGHTQIPNQTQHIAKASEQTVILTHTAHTRMRINNSKTRACRTIFGTAHSRHVNLRNILFAIDRSERESLTFIYGGGFDSLKSARLTVKDILATSTL